MHSNSLQRTTASNSKDEGDLTEMHLFGTSKNCTFYLTEINGTFEFSCNLQQLRIWND